MKQIKLDKLDITVHEATVGEVIDLLTAYCETNDVDWKDTLSKMGQKGVDSDAIDVEAAKLFNLANIINGLPMAEKLINKLVEITENGEKRSYRDLRGSDVERVFATVREVNKVFFQPIEMLLV